MEDLGSIKSATNFFIALYDHRVPRAEPAQTMAQLARKQLQQQKAKTGTPMLVVDWDPHSFGDAFGEAARLGIVEYYPMKDMKEFDLDARLGAAGQSIEGNWIEIRIPYGQGTQNYRMRDETRLIASI